ncbi:hypothetical protein [Streptacidiphilus carbonis]|uniref:hypothetical protein n=1 Tax=Streptacidiphilus carbonis TaxID=105422 RepID=UPI0005A7707E|nr:hypothetical protein [Streptacidiphilus carbonis]
MTPVELRDLLVSQLPSTPGVARAEVWQGRPYGLGVQLDGHQNWVCWMVTGASNVAPAASGQEQPELVGVPDLTATKPSLATVEQALLAAAVTAPGVLRVDRYSTRPTPTAVGAGATVDFADGWRLFLSVVGTTTSLDPKERLRQVTADSAL